MTVEEPERLDLRSHDIAAHKRDELLRLFPEIRTDNGMIDFDRLKLALGESVDVGKERYGMTWPGKADCFKAIQTPSMGTLLPSPDQSVNWDTTENLIIEGDNLEVLKLLQKSYLGKVKMIYIDPPYNTGNDFIYPDNYSESLQTYLEYTGQVDAEGKKFNTNSDADGRFHSKWMTMMYPRLYLARNLLRQDGAIFVSIDDKEVDNLRKLCNEVFGEDNFVEELVWAQNTTHSQSPLYSTNHEYVMVYARSRRFLEESADAFREPKPGYVEISELVSSMNPDYPSITEIEAQLVGLMREHREQFATALSDAGLDNDDDLASKEDPWRGVYNYRHAEYRDSSGDIVAEGDARKRAAAIWVWRESDTSAPASKQAASTKDPESPNFRFYKPPHPKTGKPCPHPKTGWRWPYQWADDGRESFLGYDRQNRIVWGDDEVKVPQFKRFLRDVDTNVAKSFFYDYTDGEKQVAELLGSAAVYPNPKPTTLVSRLIQQVCTSGDLVLDFFAGSGTTAHAVLNENNQRQANLRFLLVQLPEVIDGTSKDQESAATFCDSLGRPRVISEITKERVRRAITRLVDTPGGGVSEDRGFRVFKLTESNFKSWRADVPADADQLAQQLELHIDHLRDGRSANDLLSEILLKSGFLLSTPIETVMLDAKPAFSIAGGALIASLERILTLDAIRAIVDLGPERVICLDESFATNDQLKANAVQLFKSKGIVFRTV